MTELTKIHSAGLHHVTSVSGPAHRNHDFYVQTLGLRLVKKTVNFDDPNTYHLYYADRFGAPGSVITFFPWHNAAAGRPGPGETGETAFAVARDALPEFSARLSAAGVALREAEPRFGAPALTFADPDGMALALIGVDHVGGDDGILGLDSVTLRLGEVEPTASVLRHVFGWRDGGRDGARLRLSAPASGAPGRHVDLVADPSERGHFGAGSVHHIAFRARDDAEQAEMVGRLQEMKLQATPQKDRHYFRSVYFREPGGILFEIATDAPGFAVDETPDGLGKSLMLPAQHEHLRQKLEATLPPLA